MPLSWNEIKDRALRFSREWADEASEDAEAQSFWNGSFDVFGVSRRRVANFERKVKKIDGRDGYIDLLWKGARNFPIPRWPTSMIRSRCRPRW